MVTVKIPGKVRALSGLLSYAYTYLLPFSNPLESRYRRNIISLSCYPPYILLPVLALTLFKNFNFETFKELIRHIVLVLKKSALKDAILLNLRDKLYKVTKNESYVKDDEICGLIRAIILAWRLYTIRLKYSRWMLKYEGGLRV